MEEAVGAFWHRLITRAAHRHYPQAAVRLVDMQKTAAIYFRALGGDPGLNVTSASATLHGARRRMLERIAGSGDKVQLTWRDAETLRLPPSIDLFPEKSLNRDLYLWLTALAVQPVSANTPWFVRSQLAAQATLTRFPGLQPRYHRLVDAALALRPNPGSLPADEAAQEKAIRQALLEPGSVHDFPPAKRPHHPVHLWLHPAPPGGAIDTASSDAAEQEGDGQSKTVDASKREAERVETPDGKNGFLMFFRAESVLSWAEFIKVNRPLDEDEPGDPRAIEDLDRISVARDEKTVASRLKFDLDLPSAAADDIPLESGLRFPEWHYKKQLMQPDHCRVEVLLARDAQPIALPPHLARTARRIRNQFEALMPAKVWFKGQFDGDELDLDACVDFTAERMNGKSPERGLYRAHRYRDRDLSCLLLADLSLSTDAWINNEGRVIDTIRDTLFLFSEALSATGDRFALYGFSSRKRDNVRIHLLKAFNEVYNANIRGRIQAIKPGFYTRMGAAIRHATRTLATQSTGQRLLLLLTDGKPNDLDIYEGRYGIEDTRVALHEARQQGLRPFCVTIDEKANSYLPHLFGPSGYVVIRKPSELPRELPLLYAQITR